MQDFDRQHDRTTRATWLRRVTLAGLVYALFLTTTLALDGSRLAGLQARSIGPAGMSGRVAAVDAVPSDPRIIWVGAATGGVWKSTSGGRHWEPVFDDQPVAAIGAIAINPKSPDVVWVGTGEGNPRNSVSVGNGIYRTLDGGRNWSHLGLEQSERIHRILLHPDDPQVAYVCAMGREWGENEQRGVFKTRDGGESWEKVLYVDPRSGCADLEMAPDNPNKLIAAMWDYRRWPWFFRSGGPGSGLHMTVDGGKSWTKLTPEDGLPEGDLGRMGIAFSPSEPQIVYAIIETKKEIAIYGSRTGGANWSRVGADPEAGNRPFYYADLRVDPQYPDRIYSLWSLISVSNDGGKSFEVLVPFAELHPDHHAMWIHPDDGNYIIAGNDGGIGISRDRGESWDFVGNLPLAQFYHVAVDDDLPYNVYGGLQDNGSWRGPSQVWESGGIRKGHWKMVGFGDGFDTRPHPDDSMIGYAMSQGGFLKRWDLHRGERKDIRPPEPDSEPLRFNWSAGIAQDPFDSDTIYYGSQFVHRSDNRGDRWEQISGDLTSDNPEWQKQAESGGLTLDVTDAEAFTSIIAIEPSPVERGQLWVGTDDGRLHLTRDGGENWSSLERKLRGVPANTWIPHIEASPHDAGTAFVVLDNHRRSDWKPYLYRTDDFGKSWKSIATDPVRGYCLSIVQDPVDPDLLFLGTEFGLWLSTNGGKSWAQFNHGIPTVGVRDLVIHPREHDLVVGTHGRAIYIIDNIAPLRGLDDEVLNAPLKVLPAQDVIQYSRYSNYPIDNDEFRGANRPYGAFIDVILNGEGLPHPDPKLERERKLELRAEAARAKLASSEGENPAADAPEDQAKKLDGTVTILIRDESGRRIRRFETQGHQGLNRIVWDLRRDGFRRPPTAEPTPFDPPGPGVLPGRYEVVVEYGEQRGTGSVRVKPDPRSSISQADRKAKLEAMLEAGAAQDRIVESLDSIQIEREALSAKVASLKRGQSAWQRKHRARVDAGEDSPQKEALEEAGKLSKRLDEAEKMLWFPPDTKGIPYDRTPWSRVRYAYGSLSGDWERPTDAQLEYLRQGKQSTRDAEKQVEEILNEVRQFKLP